MIDIIVILILLVIIVTVTGYLVRAGKKGRRCIGCPNASNCSAKRRCIK